MIKINMLSYADKIKGQGVGTVYIELMKLLKKRYKKDLEITVNKTLKKDIMHAHTTDPISYLRQRISKGKSLTHVHFLPNTLDGALKLPKLFLKIYENFVLKFYLKSDYLVVVNPNYVDFLVKKGYEKERIFYIPNFVSKKEFFQLKKKEILKLRKKYKYKKEDFIVISVGQLHKGKGVFDFFECARLNPEIKFIWVGGFNFGKFMEGYKEIKKIYDNPYPNLKFTGILKRNEINKYLNISDLFFLPSFVESFALVAIEAANTNKPILLRDLEEYKKIYKDNYLKGTGVLEYSKIIKELKNNKELYKKYVEKSMKIKKEYDEEKISKKWFDLYSKIKSKID